MALYFGHVLGHDRANGRAGRKKEISHIDFFIIVLLGNGVTVLVDELKIGDGMVFLFIVQRAIDQFGVHHRGLVNGQSLLGRKCSIHQINDDGRQNGENNEKKPVFGKKPAHSVGKSTGSKGIYPNRPASSVLKLLLKKESVCMPTFLRPIKNVLLRA